MKPLIIHLFEFLGVHVGLILDHLTLGSLSFDRRGVLFLAIAPFTRDLSV
jgi:hypothetical protein